MHKDTNLNGALTGLAVAAATHWARYDEETQRRLRNVRLDAEEALDLVRDLQSHGDATRSRLPVVMDAQVGLYIASPQPATASVIPSTAPMTRPDLAAQMEKAVADLTWPPEPGQYDERGLVKQAGELTSMYLALTYEEIRAFVQEQAQSRPPSREAKGQIFLAANALVAQLSTQRLTWQQCKDTWTRLFGSTTPSSSAPVHAAPHQSDLRGRHHLARVPAGERLRSGPESGGGRVHRNTGRAAARRLTDGRIHLIRRAIDRRLLLSHSVPLTLIDCSRRKGYCRRCWQ